MSAEPGDICAQCKHFRMKEYPDHARVGLGRCMGYDKAQPLSNPFHSWRTRACVRFERDWAGKATREAWIEKQGAQASQQEVKG